MSSHFNTAEMLKSTALSLMAKANNNLFLPVIVVLISFAFGQGKSIFDFHLCVKSDLYVVCVDCSL